MTVRVFGCKRFRRLLSEREDRNLVAQEESFLEQHREACSECREFEDRTDSAFDMLRSVALNGEATGEFEPARGFEARVIRRHRVEVAKDSLSYWSPAFLGAGLACAAVLAAMYLVTMPAAARDTHPKGSEARRTIQQREDLPELRLTRATEFIR